MGLWFSSGFQMRTTNFCPIFYLILTYIHTTYVVDTLYFLHWLLHNNRKPRFLSTLSILPVSSSLYLAPPPRRPSKRTPSTPHRPPGRETFLEGPLWAAVTRGEGGRSSYHNPHKQREKKNRLLNALNKPGSHSLRVVEIGV